MSTQDRYTAGELPVPQSELTIGTEEYNKEVQNVEGIKNDAGKPPLGLISPYFLDDISMVLGFGAKKYGAGNWRKGIKFTRLISAAKRHISAVEKGEIIDPESGISHLAHAATNMMMLDDFIRAKRSDLDDLMYKESNK